MGCHLHRRTVLGKDHPAADQVPYLSCRQLFAADYGQHARHCHRAGGVDTLYLCVCVRGADDVGVGLTGPIQIGDVAAAAGDKSLILNTTNGSANLSRAHCSPPSIRTGPVQPRDIASSCNILMELIGAAAAPLLALACPNLQ